MRLLFVHDRFGDLAGAEANVLTTAAELQRRGHEVGILHGPGTGRGEVAWRKVFADRFPLEPADAGDAARVALVKFQAEVVYLHKLADLAVLEALGASGAPVVRMVHDHELYCLRGYKYRYLSRRICQRALSPYCVFPCGACVARNHDGGFPLRWMSYTTKKRELELNRQFQRMVVATDYMKEELLRNGFDPDRIEIHAPVPRTADTGITSSFSGRNRLIYAGQIIRGKGVDVLLEALALVREPFECLIFGEGNHRAFCERLCHRLGLDDRVTFKGYVPQALLPAYFREATAMVLSSVWPEPFGAVGLEGMRHGLPVVAFDAGGIKEWLQDGHNGFLVPWMDREVFATRVEQLLRDKTLARTLGENGRHFGTTRYGFSGYITGLEGMLVRVVADSVGLAEVA